MTGVQDKTSRTAAAGVVLAGVSRYADLATQVRQACGMADGWQRVDRGLPGAVPLPWQLT